MKKLLSLFAGYWINRLKWHELCVQSNSRYASYLKTQNEITCTRRLRFFGKIQKRIRDLKSYGFFDHYQKTEDPKGSFTMRMGCPRAPRDEKNRGKNNKLILAPKARKKLNIN